MSSPEQTGPVVVCTYRVRTGEETTFERLLKRHTPTLRRLGLITDYPAQVLRQEETDGPIYVEIFEWASRGAASRAAEVPDAIAIWEPMAAVCESRDGHSGLAFPTFERIGPSR